MSLKSAVRKLRKVVGDQGVLCRPEELLTYEYDGGIDTGMPDVVVFPRTTAEVSRIVAIGHAEKMAIVPRGAGTGLSGGAIAREGGIVLAFARMNQILEIDVENERAVVQPGVVNLDLSAASAPHGYYFAPDPSSQKACTIGGNVAENSGGPHTLSLGVTVNHVTGLTVVLPDAKGTVIKLGSKCAHTPGYDLTGFFVGSEGTLGIVTEIIVKLTKKPEAVATLLAIFETVDDAAATVVAITSECITPAALEMLDGWTLRTVEAATHAGYPLDSAAVLLIELEGLREQVEEQAESVARVCMNNRAREVRRARDERERELLWKGRKNAFGAIGRVSPSYYVQDGVIPRTKMPETLRRIAEISEKYGLVIGNIFHAGDGNLHPLIMFDNRDPEQTRKTIRAGAEILRHCIAVGGSITGEHGVGMEKQDLMCSLFSAADLAVMRGLRDAFNPQGLLNPQKLLPSTKMCRETLGTSPESLSGVAVQGWSS